MEIQGIPQPKKICKLHFKKLKHLRTSYIMSKDVAFEEVTDLIYILKKIF